MKLHQTNDYCDAIAATSNYLGLRTILVEKDYWITYVLWNLSRSQYRGNVVFKGGTSLSKAYKIAKRFSEDVDLALINVGDGGVELSSNQIKSLLKKVESSIAISPLVPDNRHDLVSKGSKFRKTAYIYPRKFDDDFGQASDRLILEINSFANPYPFQEREITSFIAQYLNFYNKALISEYQLDFFKINVLDLSKTFAEKVMGLVRTSYQSNQSLDQLKQKVRHVYDVSKLMEQETITNLISNFSEFFLLLKQVREEDQKNNEFQGEWSSKKLSDAIIFSKPSETLHKLESTIKGDFKGLLFDVEEIPALEIMEKQLKHLHVVLSVFDEQQ